jgi:hypothetical protein
MPLVITIGQVEGPPMRKAMRAGKASAAHPGFEAAPRGARNAGGSEARGREARAAGARPASPPTGRRNPRRAKVSGVKKPKKGGGEAEA